YPCSADVVDRAPSPSPASTQAGRRLRSLQGELAISMTRTIADQASAQGAAANLVADKQCALKIGPVSRETEERLDRYVALLLEWQPKTNLIAPSTISSLWTRHVADSLQLLALAPAARIWIDLGSGGGFPGIVLACALADEPNAMVHL